MANALVNLSPLGKGIINHIFIARRQAGVRHLCGAGRVRARVDRGADPGGVGGGRPYTMTAAKRRLAQAAMGQPETRVGELCKELNITRPTRYRHVRPQGALRPDGLKLLAAKPRTGGG